MLRAHKWGHRVHDTRERQNVDGAESQGRVAALIPAAGEGRRMGGAMPKQFLPIGGRAILAHTLDIFETSPLIDEVWVVVSGRQRHLCETGIIQRYGFKKVKGVVAGGQTRQESVWQGLQQISEACQLVVVHDGVRPFLTECLLQQTLEVASRYGAASAAIPLKDTLKRVSKSGTVEVTIPREDLWRIQTPQAFHRIVLREAFQQARQKGFEATDEAGLVEALGYPVKIVQGLEHNIKVTTPDDLIFCETYLRSHM